MKRLIAASALVLFAGIAAAQPQARVGVANQSVENGAVTIHDVVLSKPGFVTVNVPNGYGHPSPDIRLGKVFLSAGRHGNVKVPLNSQLMTDSGYRQGTEHTAFVEVVPKQALASTEGHDMAHMTMPGNQPVAVTPMQLGVPNPVDSGD